jgi:hypothetical protein
LTFLIHDAIRCNGVDLTDLNIRSRMNVIQVKLVKHRKFRLLLTNWQSNWPFSV